MELRVGLLSRSMGSYNVLKLLMCRLTEQPRAGTREKFSFKKEKRITIAFT